MAKVSEILTAAGITPYYYDAKGDIAVVHADCRDVTAQLPENSVDAVACDPPYALTQNSRGGSARVNDPETPFGRTHLGEKGFMGQTWDTGKVAFDPATWINVLRVCKPGAHLLAFGGTRTFHRLTCAIEDSGWEVRDCLMWLYGQGFPKSLDVSKAIDKSAGAEREVVGVSKHKSGIADANAGPQSRETDHAWAARQSVAAHFPITAPATDAARQWSGYGTALKPAWEPIILARKPLEGTVAENVQTWDCGALNIDGGRIGTETRTYKGSGPHKIKLDNHGKGDTGVGYMDGDSKDSTFTATGRFPANLLLDEEAAAMLDEQSGQSTSPVKVTRGGKRKQAFGMSEQTDVPCYADCGGASRFFYTSKASGKDRGNLPAQSLPLFGESIHEFRNTHPTVKPTDLMEYLCTLLRTPTGGVFLDPFGGSGTTAVACKALGLPCIVCEIEERYASIASERLRQEVLSFGVD